MCRSVGDLICLLQQPSKFKRIKSYITQLLLTARGTLRAFAEMEDPELVPGSPMVLHAIRGA